MNTRELLPRAKRRLKDAPSASRVVLIYAGIVTALGVLTTLLSYLLGLQINRSGGLSGMSTRSVLSTVQSMLPLIQSVVVMCLTLGHRAAMLRVARGQYVSEKTLRLGFDRFWVLLRASLIQGLILLSVGLASMYLSTMVFVLTPLSRRAMEILTPMMSSVSALSPDLILDEAVVGQLMDAMLPMVVIFPVVFALLATPILLRYRMVDYVIIDKPGLGALAAMRESRSMMRYNCMKLLGLDFRLWWYYALSVLATLLCYSDQLLPLLGITLPVGPKAAYYGSYALYLVVQFAIYYYLYNRVEVTYALAYEELRPRETEQGGVVLGNIFNM